MLDGADSPEGDFGQQLTVLSGWRDFVASTTAKPMTLLTRDEYDALSKEEKYDYDEDRLDHHARLQVVATSTVRKTVTCGRRLTILNRGAISARRGLIVT